MMKYATRLFCIFLINGLISVPSPGQMSLDVKGLVQKFKEDPKGPYKDIRWFCKDGTVLPPQEKCPEPGGIQRARYKDEVVQLAEKEHLFIGQILAGTKPEDFWDAANQQSRLKQYQFEQYLRSADDQWVWKKAQYYRGALQAEDEEKWGLEFFRWLLPQTEVISQNYFLIRQATKDIPHRGDTKLTREVRALSKEISDAYTPFLNTRVKIHGQPDPSDISRVKSFMTQHDSKLTPELKSTGLKLIQSMEKLYEPVTQASMEALLKRIIPYKELYPVLRNGLIAFYQAIQPSEKLDLGSDLLWEIRMGLPKIVEAQARLDLLDLSVTVENQLLYLSASWEPGDLAGLLHKISALGQSLAATGFLEVWEYQSVQQNLRLPDSNSITIDEIRQAYATGKNLVQWGSLMIRATYQAELTKYSVLSDKITGISDDWIRSSLLLSMGDAVSTLGVFLSRETDSSGKLFETGSQGSLRGLNPGYCQGELVVVGENDPIPELERDKVYILHHPPADMKPVAGIATASEGNLVSHVQLLARNLGIPNALVGEELLPVIKKYSGKKVFFAVSPANVVILKTADQMTEVEEQLFEVKQRSSERVRVPIDKIQLNETGLLNLSKVDASFSGTICGPKAANLGELKKLFPEHVVNGIVLPFGLFKKHMDQMMPGNSLTYWEFLVLSFKNAELAREKGQSEKEVERTLLLRLEELRAAIKEMPFIPGFVDDLRKNFIAVFGKKPGQVPVFLRSDTNMEDLKDFTGAGLNLTLFNVLEESKILQGIRDVWASPYSERSFRWRQLYLENPENVFPSLLIIPSVNVECSGVMITRTVGRNDKEGLTVAFSRGAGGAVEGQVAESYWLFKEGDVQLIAPSREAFYNSLPAKGGTQKNPASFEQAILNQDRIKELKRMAGEIKSRLAVPGEITDPGYDIELGFLGNTLWLFQIRPFVENKNARSSAYLSGLDPIIDGTKRISLASRVL